MDYWEQGSHARGVYLTQFTLRMGTVRVKQQEKADARIMQDSSKKYGREERGHEGEKSPKLGPTSAEDLTIELPEGREAIDQTSLT